MTYRSLALMLASASAIIALGACSRKPDAVQPAAPSFVQSAMAPVAAPNPERNAYFGNVHVHTGWSFDGMTNGSKTAPADAYAWAQGKEITNSGVGGKIQIQTPDFKPGERAFYYARVLEIPTPRWSTIDAVKLGIAVPEGLPVSIQEHAWSSAIWYSPN